MSIASQVTLRTESMDEDDMFEALLVANVTSQNPLKNVHFYPLLVTIRFGPCVLGNLSDMVPAGVGGHEGIALFEHPPAASRAVERPPPAASVIKSDT